MGVVEAGGIEQHDYRRLNLETSCLENVWTFYEKSDDGLRLRLRLEFELRMYSLHELRELLGRGPAGSLVSSFTRGRGRQRHVAGEAGLTLFGCG